MSSRAARYVRLLCRANAVSGDELIAIDLGSQAMVRTLSNEEFGEAHAEFRRLGYPEGCLGGWDGKFEELKLDS